MSEYIPLEIQQEIIKKLTHVKFLVRCRSVSKPWKAFIDSTDFISSFCVPHTDPHRLIIRYNHPKEKYVLIADDDHTNYPRQELPPIVHEFNEILRDVRLVGSSHGLFCLHGSFRDISYYRYYSRNEMIILQNPTIRKSIAIIAPYSWYSNAYVGFAVCPVTNDPTIVKIAHENISWGALRNGYRNDWEVHVFTLSSRSWKAVTTNLPRCSINVSWSQLWDSVAVLEYTPGSVNQVCTVWMMEDDDDVTKSFTKLFAIRSPDANLKTVIGFKNGGEPIMETHYNHEEYAKLEVYEPWSKQISDLGVHGEDESFCVSSYMETLLLLDHSDCSVID